MKKRKVEVLKIEREEPDGLARWWFRVHYRYSRTGVSWHWVTARDELDAVQQLLRGWDWELR